MTTTPHPPRPDTVTLLPDTTPGTHPIANTHDLRWWAPLIGPTCTTILLLCADLPTEGRTYPINELGTLIGRQMPSRVWRALERLERFGAAQFTGAGTVLIRMELPTVADRYLERLPHTFTAQYTTGATR